MRESPRQSLAALLWRTLAAYWIFLFCATHMPKLELPGPRDSDKFAHFAAFGGLAALVWFARACESPPPRFLTAVWVWLLIAVYAMLDELTQPTFGRTGDPLDWVADMGGVTIGLLISMTVRRPERI